VERYICVDGPAELPPTVRRAPIPTPTRKSVNSENPNRFCPADCRLIFIAQCRLLATRAENGLPVDVRSFLNLIRSFRELLIAGAAQ
jgi:hypothetical protein